MHVKLAFYNILTFNQLAPDKDNQSITNFYRIKNRGAIPPFIFDALDKIGKVLEF